jgi:serine/threonine protein kinase
LSETEVVEGRGDLCFEGFSLERRLSVGGTSEVFLARSPSDGAQVVIKRLLPGLADDVEGPRRLSHEASLLAVLDHVDIPRLLGRGETHLVLSHFDGVDLRDLLVPRIASGEPAPPSFVAAVGLLSALVLHDLHEARDLEGRPLRAVHADVSPRNLRLRSNGQIGIVDFGSSRHALAEVPPEGLIVGTHAYMSPEQVRAEPLDLRSDLFSLGVILWELAAARRLFKRDTAASTLAAVETMDAPRLDLTLRSFPASLADPIGACLSRDRAYRPARAEDLAAAFAAFLDGSERAFDIPRASAIASSILATHSATRQDDGPSLAEYRASLARVALGEDPQLTPERTDITRVSDASELAALMSGLRTSAPRAIAGESPGTHSDDEVRVLQTHPPRAGVA